jgi:predicted transcriptional regulator
MSSRKHKVTLEDFEKDKTLSERLRRSRGVAQALDAKADVLPYARRFTSMEFEQFVTELTPRRLELLRLAIKRHRSIAELATASRRDQSAVSRDVARLERLGLVKVETVANPGHGQMKIVTPVATRIAIDANLAAA